MYNVFSYNLTTFHYFDLRINQFKKLLDLHSKFDYLPDSLICYTFRQKEASLDNTVEMIVN